jgi:hypothetical protein
MAGCLKLRQFEACGLCRCVACFLRCRQARETVELYTCAITEDLEASCADNGIYSTLIELATMMLASDIWNSDSVCGDLPPQASRASAALPPLQGCTRITLSDLLRKGIIFS